MKKTFLIRLLLPLAAVAGAGIWMKMNTNKTPDNQMLRAVLAGSFEAKLDPSNISSISLYHIHFNLWDTLLSQEKGRPGIAVGYTVSDDGRSYVFKLSPEAKFSNGRAITAEDAKFAIERLARLGSSGHVGAKSLIEKVEADSAAQTLTIRLYKATPSFAYLVSVPEFGIVPREAVDDRGEVVRLDMTSGPYSVESLDVAAQRILLRKNPYSRAHAAASPEQVELSLVKNPTDVASRMKDGRADFAEFRSAPSALAEVLQLKELTAARTRPSLSIFLNPIPGKLSAPTMRRLAWLFQSRFRPETRSDIETQAQQFLPPQTFGSLDQNEIPVLTDTAADIPHPLVIKTWGTDGTSFAEEIQAFLEAQDIETKVVPQDSKQEAHMELGGQGMNADFPEIEMHLAFLSSYAWLPVTSRLRSLITESFHEPREEKRSALIKQASREILTTGAVIPLTVRSYVHFYRDAVVGAESGVDYDGDIPFYRMRMK